MKKTLMEVLQQYNMDLKKEGALFRIFCPFHDDTGKPNLTVYPDTDSWYCFACNVGGDASKFVSLIEGISYSQAEARVKGEAVEVSELKDRLNTDTEQIQTFNNEINLLVSEYCRKYLKQNPMHADSVMDYLKEFDKELMVNIQYPRMKEILENLKQKFKIPV
jgi:DNA primase